MKTSIIRNVQTTEFSRAITNHVHASLFSSPSWIAAVANGYGLEISASVRSEGGEIEDAILFGHVTDIRGERVVCIPFSDYSDPLVTEPELWTSLIEPILALEVPISLRCLRNQIPLADDRFTCTGQALWHGVDLSRTEDEIWHALASSARQNIRKAQRSGVVVREGRTLEDVRLFHRMHSSLRKSKYRLLAQPFGFFEAIYQAFIPDDRITVLLAEVDEQTIAGIFLLEHNDTLYYKFNASFDQRYRPNDLLAWQALLLGHRRGLHKFDFGLSDIDQPGLVRYKKKFATEELKISILRHRPEGYTNVEGDAVGKLLGRTTRWLTDPAVPDEITREAGDELYRFFC